MAPRSPVPVNPGEFGPAAFWGAATTALVAKNIRELRETLDATTSLRGRFANSWQRLRGRTAEDRRLQPLYWEVLYNVQILRAAQLLNPPQFLAVDAEWRRPAAADYTATKVTPYCLATISSAYMQCPAYVWLFRQGWLRLFADRVRGADQTALEGLATAFAEAERQLRVPALGTSTASKLEEAMLSDPSVLPKSLRPLSSRATGAVLALADPPYVQVLLGFGTVFGLSQVVGWVAERLLAPLRSAR